MIEIFMIALASIGIAVVVVWLYRKVTESRGASASMVSLSDHRSALRLSAQQGFVRLHGEPTAVLPRAGTARKSTRAIRPGRPIKTVQSNKGVRKPWGW